MSSVAAHTEMRLLAAVTRKGPFTAAIDTATKSMMPFPQGHMPKAGLMQETPPHPLPASPCLRALVGPQHGCPSPRTSVTKSSEPNPGFGTWPRFSEASLCHLWPLTQELGFPRATRDTAPAAPDPLVTHFIAIGYQSSISTFFKEN